MDSISLFAGDGRHPRTRTRTRLTRRSTSVFYLFLMIKMELSGRHFDIYADIIAAADHFLEVQDVSSTEKNRSTIVGLCV